MTGVRRRWRATQRSSGLPTGLAFGGARLPASTSAIGPHRREASRAWQRPRRTRGDDDPGERQAGFIGLARRARDRCRTPLVHCFGQSQPRRWQADHRRRHLPYCPHARHPSRSQGPAAWVAPHRHYGGSDAFNGDYRKTRAFSRHTSLDTVRRYDDNRADHAGQVAHALDAILG